MAYVIDYLGLGDKWLFIYDEQRWAEEHMRRYVPPPERPVQIVEIAITGPKPEYWKDSVWLIRDRADESISYASYSKRLADEWAAAHIRTHSFPEEAALNSMVWSMENGLTRFVGVKYPHERGAIHPQAEPGNILVPEQQRLAKQFIDEGQYHYAVYAANMREAMRSVMDSEIPLCACNACLRIRELYC